MTKEKENVLMPEERKQVDMLFHSLIAEMKKRCMPDVSLLKKAYHFAMKSHGETKRRSGEPYIMHPLEVAKILAEVGFESDLIAAAILHDVIEDCNVTATELEQRFGSLIADTVDAVSKVSEKFTGNPDFTKMDIDNLSDIKFLTETTKKNNRKAFYIKLADRIHNLKTINIFPEEQQKAKAAHTRNILIPAAKKMHIFKLVDILESLCLEIENPKVYHEIRYGYRQLLNESRDAIDGEYGLRAFWKQLLLEREGVFGKNLVLFEFHERYEDSIYRHLNEEHHNVYDIKNYMKKKYIPLYDINFIVSDLYNGSPESLFFQCYPRLHESKFRLTITGINRTMGSDAMYYELEDRYGTKYRLFCQSESELLEYSHGVMISGDIDDIRSHIVYINEAEPDEPEHKKIPVYRKDGSLMELDEGATVLDFAFAINPYIGICAKFAYLNGTTAEVPIYTRLRPGDMVHIVSDHKKGEEEFDVPHATVRWFEYVHTREAIKSLSRWMETNMDRAVPKMMVYDEKGNPYEIEMGSTVLDFAFVLNKEKGLHVRKAYLNKCPSASPLDRILKYGDRVRFTYDDEEKKTPEFNWLSIVKTKLAKEVLIEYFNSKYNMI